MAGFNMPPGVSPSDIPGNNKQTVEWDNALSYGVDQLTAMLDTPEEITLAVAIGIAAVIGTRSILVQIKRAAASEARDEALEGK